MNSIKKQFDFELMFKDNLLIIEAEITPGRTMIPPSLNSPGEPPEASSVEILSCSITDGIETNIDFHPEGIAEWDRSSGGWIPLEDIIEDEALEYYYEYF